MTHLDTLLPLLLILMAVGVDGYAGFLIGGILTFIGGAIMILGGASKVELYDDSERKPFFSAPARPLHHSRASSSRSFSARMRARSTAHVSRRRRFHSTFSGMGRGAAARTDRPSRRR